MALNSKQRSAVFEKLAKAGKLTTQAPKIATPHPKMLDPIAPKVPAVATNSQVNPNFVGNPKAQRFQKIKRMFGL